MNTQLIRNSWNNLASQHHEVVESFYARLFQRHPAYQALFAPGSMHEQMQRMVHTLALVSQHADGPAVIHPYLARLGLAHQGLGLGPDDFERFAGTLIEVIAEQARAAQQPWSEACEKAWRQAFEEIIQPIMSIGMER
jgi:hemoglobin-like flavoprotein